MEQSILELPIEQKNLALKELKALQMTQPMTKTDMLYQSLCSLFWLSPLGYLKDSEKYNECWNILYLKD